MIEKFQFLWEHRPLVLIMALAAIFRILAAIFSPGFSMYDDHFLVIEVAQRWVDGYDDWFRRGTAAGHSIVYPGLHYILFSFLERINVLDPQSKMFVVRLIHAFYSLLIVLFGYRIALKLSNIKTARQVGLILALFWILPFMSVRNLIEVVCIPPLLIGFYISLEGEETNNNKLWILAGIVFGFAFVFRYQTLIIIGGVGLILLIQKKWKPLYNYVIGFLLTAFLVQGIIDWIAWGSPFASFYNYVIYNYTHQYNYTTGSWYLYVLLILGIFIPPTSFILAFGFAKTWKKVSLIFWPTVLFLLLHSFFPNKQERFILPILPFFLFLGFIGWNKYVTTSKYWNNNKRVLKGFWLWFWAMNSILLILVTFTYTKKARVETLHYLSHKNHVMGVIIENYKKGVPRPPAFYLNKKEVPIYHFTPSKSYAQLKAEISSSNLKFPNYIIFLTEKEIRNRVSKFETLFSKQLEFEQRVDPSLLDHILHKLNPTHNVNLTSYIYKISE